MMKHFHKKSNGFAEAYLRRDKRLHTILGVLLLCYGYLQFHYFYHSHNQSYPDSAAIPLPPTKASMHRNSTSASSSAPFFWKMDVLTIGSQKRLDFVSGQRETFGRHRSIRWWMVAHEGTDAHPDCPHQLTRWKVKQVSNWCHNRKRYKTSQFVMKYLQQPYASTTWLMKKADPAGWMCAQSRPAQALYHLLHYYQEQARITGADLLSIFPDYLLVIDDDTYVDMDQLQTYLTKTSPYYQDPFIPSAMAGCRVRSPSDEINLTIPFGGYGQVFSRGYLQALTQPIHCESNRPLCQTIRRISHFDERDYFLEATPNNSNHNFSMVDLIFQVATRQPFLEQLNWTRGFCYHSDWIWGIVTNFYNLSRHNVVEDPAYTHVPQERLEAWGASELDASTGERYGICRYVDASHCPPEAPVCHYMSPANMTDKLQVLLAKHPTHYRDELPQTILLYRNESRLLGSQEAIA